MLGEMEKSQGGRPKKNLSHDDTGLQTPSSLSELGISRVQSARWQTIATIPEEIFEKHMKETISSEKELTTSGTLRLARDMKKQNHLEAVASSDSIESLGKRERRGSIGQQRLKLIPIKSKPEEVEQCR